MKTDVIRSAFFDRIVLGERAVYRTEVNSLLYWKKFTSSQRDVIVLETSILVLLLY